MSKASDSLLNYIRAVAGARRNDPRDDAELIARFVESRDEKAFATLVNRHSTLVWQTCQRILGDTPDAEDAFQTVFLALTHKAGRFPVRSLVGWLYRVARRVALRTRTSVYRRRDVEQKSRAVAKFEAEGDLDRAKLHAGLDEELAGLPEKLRVPLLLHFIEGKSQVEVAKIMGCARRALQKRLEKGEAILRERLERRGLTLGTLSMAALLGDTSNIPAMPAGLISSTTRAAMAFSTGTLTGVTADGAQKLLRSLTMEGVKRTGWWLMLACVGFFGVGGGGLVAWRMFSEGSKPMKNQADPIIDKTKAPTETRSERVDCYGDPLPNGALARIGTVRFNTGTTSLSSNGEAAFLPDGKTLVSVHGGNTVYFWEVASGKELQRLQGPEKCQSVAVSCDGKKLAVVGKKEVKVWNLDTHPPQLCFLKEYQKTIDQGAAVAFTPDSKMLAVSIERELPVWLLDSSNGKLRQSVNDKPNPNSKLSFTSDSSTLVASNGLWEIATGQRRHDSALNRKWDRNFKPLLLSSDGAMLVTVELHHSRDEHGFHHILSLWDAKTGARRHQLVNDIRLPFKSFLAFLPDGHTLLEVAGPEPERQEYLIRFWDSVAGKAKPSTVVLGKSPLSEQGRFCLSPDGKRLAEVWGQEVHVWDVGTGQPFGPAGVISEGIGALAFAPDNKQLATLSSCRELQLWDTDTGRPQQEIRKFGEKCLAMGLDYSDSHRIEVISYDGNDVKELIRWDPRNGEMFSSSFQLPEVDPLIQELKLDPSRQDCPRDFGCIDYPVLPNYPVSPNGRWRLWGTRNGFILEDRSKKRVAQCFPWTTKRDASYPHRIAVSDDGSTVFSCYAIRQNGKDLQDRFWFECWSAATGMRLIGTELNARRGFSTIALSPDGRQIATVANNENNKHGVCLTEVISGTERVWLDASKEIQSIAWSLDGRLIAGGDEEGAVWLWDTATGQKVCYFTGHRSGVKLLVFSRNRQQLASASDDLTVLIWDLHGQLHSGVNAIQSMSTEEELWTSVGKKDAAEAWLAMCTLTQHADIALPLLRKQLRMPMDDTKKVTKLLAGIDNDDFFVRKKSMEELAKMGSTARLALQDALARKPSPEAKEKIVRLLKQANHVFYSARQIDSKELQCYRGVEILERIGNPEARKVLEELSQSRTLLAQDALAALHRMKNPTDAPAP